MKHSTRMILPVLAVALLLTGCGSHRRDKSEDRTGVTSRNDVVSRAEEMASDAVRNGKEMASDAVQDGKEIASDAVQNGKELVSEAAEDVSDAMHKGDGDGDYRTDSDGRVRDDD